MLDEMMFLQIGGFSGGGFFGGTFGNILAQWEQLGVFSYVLPFLLIFALLFGILTRLKIFDNKSINAVISVSVALMALQYDFVPRFFSEIFPNLGIGLSVILVGIIVLGLFTDTNWTWIGAILGVVIFGFIIGTSFEFGTSTFWFWVRVNLATIIAVGIMVGFVIAMIFNPIHFETSKDNVLAKAITQAMGGGK